MYATEISWSRNLSGFSDSIRADPKRPATSPAVSVQIFWPGDSTVFRQGTPGRNCPAAIRTGLRSGYRFSVSGSMSSLSIHSIRTLEPLSVRRRCCVVRSLAASVPISVSNRVSSPKARRPKMLWSTGTHVSARTWKVWVLTTNSLSPHASDRNRYWSDAPALHALHTLAIHANLLRIVNLMCN